MAEADSLQTPGDAVASALAPFRKQVQESGMTDEDLDAFFDEIREEIWQENHPKTSGPRT